MKIAIVGSRDCGDFSVEKMLDYLPQNCSAVIVGGAKGIDTIAEQAALIKQIKVIKILPDYEKYGRAAPIVRNTEIVEKADLLIAFWDFNSKGTANALSHCVEKGVPFKIIGLK